MKAKDLKIGMSVRNGHSVINIVEIIKGQLKNGKETITVKGDGYWKPTKNITKPLTNTEYTFKAETKVKLA